MEPSLDHARLKELGELHPSALRVAVIEARRERDAALAKIEALEAELSMVRARVEVAEQNDGASKRLCRELDQMNVALQDLVPPTTADGSQAHAGRDGEAMKKALDSIYSMVTRQLAEPQTQDTVTLVTIAGTIEALDRAKGGTPA